MGDLSLDITLASPPEDSISDLAWCPKADFLAVASWDCKVRIYDVTTKSAGEGKAIMNYDGPALGCAWSPNGNQVAGCSADKTVRLLDLAANGVPSQQIATHDAPIRALRFFEFPGSSAPMLVTGSWDKTIKYWDLRQQTPAATVACQDKVYSLDIKKDLLVVATAQKHINIIKLTEPTKFLNTTISPLKSQIRTVKCFHDGSGYGTGSIEGRCAFQWINAADAASRNFTFKCHRTQRNKSTLDCYSVNAISFHPVFGTFSTAGSDGSFHFWDKDKRLRVRGFPTTGGPITATDFNNDGKRFAYAVSYDWSKGFAFNTPDHVNKVMIHPTNDLDCKPR